MNTKNRIIITITLISVIIFTSGCINRKNENRDNSQTTDNSLTLKVLENKIIDYGKSLIESEAFKNSINSDVIISLSLSDFEKSGKDISIFKNNSCDNEKSKVTIKVTIGEDDKHNYTYSTELFCFDE